MAQVTVTWDDAFVACASRRFADLVAAGSPYASLDAALSAARHIWWNEVNVAGWLEAFAAHPKLGDARALRDKYAGAGFGAHSNAEQAAALGSGSEAVFEELAALNTAYEQRFGHIFILCASGRTAPEMLAALKQRIAAPPVEELSAAAREQMKITELRLTKQLATRAPPAASPTASRAAVRTGQLADHLAPAPTAAHAAAPLRSPITTHVLDASLGVPAQGLPLWLTRLMDGSGGAGGSGVWDPVAAGVTDADGRVSNLLPPSGYVAPGTYRMTFDTGSYLRACRERHPSVFSAVPFYPTAYVDFTITPEMTSQHFHIPLLLSPYSYSTYRGS